VTIRGPSSMSAGGKFIPRARGPRMLSSIALLSSLVCLLAFKVPGAWTQDSKAAADAAQTIQCEAATDSSRMDVAAAERLASLAMSMEDDADSARSAFGQAVVRMYGSFESLVPEFFMSAAEIAETAVRLNPGDPGHRILHAELMWRATDIFAPGFERQEAILSEARCAVELARLDGDEGLVQRAEHLIRQVEP